MKKILRIMNFKFIRNMILYLGLFSLILILHSERVVKKHSVGKTFSNLDSIPNNHVGLLLGTAKYTTDGRYNLYYKSRINAAVKLYNAGKIDKILVSGDNGTKSYDEPTTFKVDLLEKGIPDSCIVLDYAGFRTLDSIVRAKEIFGQEKFTIISQKFHNERALCIASAKKINAVAWNAKDVPRRYQIKVSIREKLARVKMLLDLIFGKDPKFLGEKIRI